MTDDSVFMADSTASHAEFDVAPVSACGSRRLLARHAHYERPERHRAPPDPYGETRDGNVEHQQIVDLALGPDADRLIVTTVPHPHHDASDRRGG